MPLPAFVPRLAIAVPAALVVTGLAASAALAHPLGNFTINHYAGVRVAPSEVLVDVVIDMAEIPAFGERRSVDVDGSGDVSAGEVAVARVARCRALADELALAVEGRPRALELRGAGLSFPEGAGGLPTLRLACRFGAALDTPLAGPTPVAFADRSYPARVGWREIVVEGDGVVVGGDVPRVAISDRLRAYPDDLLAQPLDVRSVAFTVSPGGDRLPPLAEAEIISVEPVGASDGSAPAAPAPAAVPGGVGESALPEVFRSAELSPWIVVLALVTAAALGAGHALTPGHGKTLMAAYLVGTRGTALHAAGLGLSVSVSHTLGILVLAVLVGGVQSALPPDLVVRVLPVVAATTIVGVGGWMFVSEIRRRLVGAREARAHEAAHAAGVDHDHHGHDAGGHGHADEGRHGHVDEGHADVGAHAHGEDRSVEHSHGGLRHSHAPARGSTITWRGLFVLGLAGGLVPSTNALLILLTTIAAGRPAYGVVLVIAFGLGMAAVMTGIGLAIVLAGERLTRSFRAGFLSRVQAHVPLGAAVVVLAIGVWLTSAAVAGVGPL